MPDVKVYIRREDFELWKQLKNKSQAVSDMLNAEGKVRVVRTVPTGGTLSKVDKRDPDVTKICKTWSDLLGPPDGSAENQRRYAKTLHKKYGDKVLSAIKIVKQIRLSDETIKPTFGNLKDVYDKWSKIEDFYNRNTKVEKKGIQY